MPPSTSKQERRVVRTTQPIPDYITEHQPRREERRVSRRVELAAALEEWAEDYEGTHSIFK